MMTLLLTSYHWVWFILAGVFLMLELTNGALFFLFWALAALLAGGAALIFSGLPFAIQSLIFAILSLVVLIVWWKIFKRRKAAESNDAASFLNNRGKNLIGTRFSLTAPIVNHRGRVQLGDTFWTLSGKDAPEGSIVEVVDVNSMELEVRRVE